MIEKFLGSYVVRDLEGENEVYFCHEGCGDCKKVSVEETNLTRHCPNDIVLLERHYSYVDLSSCCKSPIGIWDTLKDEEVKVELVFVPPVDK